MWKQWRTYRPSTICLRDAKFFLIERGCTCAEGITEILIGIVHTKSME